MAKKVMQKFYREADGRPDRLPWHRDEPGKMLVDAVRARGGRGRALDLGCGSGVFSIWLAKQGMDVTGLDLFPEAVSMGNAQAEAAGVDVAFVCGDLFSHAPSEAYDLVFDSGCLHSLVGGSVPAYKAQLMTWLAPDGDYVLGHWGKRHALDWRPIGPKRRSRETIEKLFAPELSIVDTDVVDFDAPFPFGPTVRGVGYRMTRAR